MVKGRCLWAYCEFLVEDGQHIDDVAQRLREHWRALHPTKFFNHSSHCQSAASYNMDWDEVLESRLGRDWEQRYAGGPIDPYVLRDIKSNTHYSPEVRAKAEEVFAAQIAAQPEIHAAEAAQARRRNRFGRAAGVPGIQQPPVEWVPEHVAFDEVQDDGPQPGGPF